MNKYMIYFRDMTSSNPHFYTENKIVEAADETSAVEKFLKETNNECRIRSVELIKCV